jgi:hypothetical protein
MTRSGITAKIGGLEDWKTGRLEDWKIGRRAIFSLRLPTK